MLPQLNVEFPRANPSKIGLYDYVIENDFQKRYLEAVEPMGESDKVTEVTGAINPYRPLNRMVSEFANNVTIAWTKMYELWHEPELKRLLDGKGVSTCHLAEFPGSFISATHRYIATRKPAWMYSKKWIWRATSLDPTEDDAVLDDRFGLYERYPKNWVLSDATKADDILKLPTQLGMKFDLVTGDIGKPVKDWKNQEAEHHDEQLGQFVSALILLDKGGVAVLKMFHCFTPQTMSLLRIATGCFDTVKVFKPRTSKMLNNEVYWILSGFSGEKLDFKTMLSALGTSKNLVPKEELTKEFLEKVERVANHQILNYTGISRAVEKYIREYKGDNMFRHVSNDMKNSGKKYASEWLKQFPVGRMGTVL